MSTNLKPNNNTPHSNPQNYTRRRLLATLASLPLGLSTRQILSVILGTSDALDPHRFTDAEIERMLRESDDPAAEIEHLDYWIDCLIHTQALARARRAWLKGAL